MTNSNSGAPSADSATANDPDSPAAGTPTNEFADPQDHRRAAQKLSDASKDTSPQEYCPTNPIFANAKSLSEKPVFQTTVIVAILLNALVLALETYPSIDKAGKGLWEVLDRIFLYFFVGELLIRLAAVGFHPGRFFRRGWNIFDFLIVAIAFVPGLPPDSTVLRLARLARVTRLLAVLPDVKVLLDGIRRSLQPVSGLAVITLFLLFIYGMIGNMLFAEVNPEQWGDIGASMMTLFTVLTLEAWSETYAAVKEATPWATPYFISFLLGAVFIVMNMVVGVILATLEEAREAARNRREAEYRAEHAEEYAEEQAREEAVLDGVTALRAEIAELKSQLRHR